MTSDTFCHYLECLAEQVKADSIDLPNDKILLFVDNHDSHVTLQSCEKAAELGIVLITFYPNATHLYQPCDKTCFKSSKSHWRKAVLQNPSKKIEEFMNEANFASTFMRAFEDFAVVESVTKNDFRASGISPWNCKAIDYSKCLGKEQQNLGEFVDDQNLLEESVEEPPTAPVMVFLDDNSNAALVKEEKLLMVTNDVSADPMFRELCRRQLVALLAQAEVEVPEYELIVIEPSDHEFIVVNEPNITVESIEIIPTDPV